MQRLLRPDQPPSLSAPGPGPSAVQTTPRQHLGIQRGGMLEQLLGALDLQPSLPLVRVCWIHADAGLGVDV